MPPSKRFDGSKYTQKKRESQGLTEEIFSQYTEHQTALILIHWERLERRGERKEMVYANNG
jgi:hypothetical protein